MKKIILSLIALTAFFAISNAQSKVAHINTSELMNAMPEMKDFEKNLKTTKLCLETNSKKCKTNYKKTIQHI